MFNKKDDQYTPMMEINEPKYAPIMAKPQDPGIYDLMKDTAGILTEVSRMLNLFACEVAAEEKCEEKRGSTEPRCFRENVYQVHELALGIRGDLDDLIRKFR